MSWDGLDRAYYNILSLFYVCSIGLLSLFSITVINTYLLILHIISQLLIIRSTSCFTKDLHIFAVSHTLTVAPSTFVVFLCVMNLFTLLITDKCVNTCFHRWAALVQFDSNI